MLLAIFLFCWIRSPGFVAYPSARAKSFVLFRSPHAPHKPKPKLISSALFTLFLWQKKINTRNWSLAPEAVCLLLPQFLAQVDNRFGVWFVLISMAYKSAYDVMASSCFFPLSPNYCITFRPSVWCSSLRYCVFSITPLSLFLFCLNLCNTPLLRCTQQTLLFALDTHAQKSWWVRLRICCRFSN